MMTGETLPGNVDSNNVKEFKLYINYVNGEARLSWETVSGAVKYQVYKNNSATDVTVYTTATTSFGDFVSVIAFNDEGTPIGYTGDKTIVKCNVPEINGTFNSFTITNNVAATTYYTVTNGLSVLTTGTVNAGQSVELSGNSYSTNGSITVTAYNESSTAVRSDTVSKTFSAGSSGGITGGDDTDSTVTECSAPSIMLYSNGDYIVEVPDDVDHCSFWFNCETCGGLGEYTTTEDTEGTLSHDMTCGIIEMGAYCWNGASSSERVYSRVGG